MRTGARIFAEQNIGHLDPVVFRTPGEYSMDVAVEIIKRLEGEQDCEIEDSGWKSAGYGALVETGILVRLGNIKFQVMCSYEEIFIKRISGNKAKFYEFCESVRTMDFGTTCVDGDEKTESEGGRG